MPPPQAAEPARWNLTAAIGAWLLPGLGHFLLGERQRGGILCVTIGILWLAGFIIGGISTFDRKEHPAWFMGQALVAPSVAADITIQSFKKGVGDPLPDNDPRYEPSYGRVNEQGILYTALAGLLNLLAILDVLYRDPKRAKQRADAQAARAAGPAAASQGGQP